KTVDMAGLPSLASRISAPAAVMAASSHMYVADTVEQALAVRGQLAPGQLIVSLDGACVGPAMLCTPTGDNADRGVLERERSIKALAAECDTASEQLDALGAELSTLETQRQSIHDETRALEEALATARRQLSRMQAELQGEQS